MAFLVTGGAVLKCTFGVAPCTLDVLPINHVMVELPAANIMDDKPELNIPTFGMCRSLANPEVIGATAAALGVLTPMPCVPMTIAPWIVGVPTVLIGNMPVVSSDTKVMCLWAGEISVVFAGQVIVTV